jgi:hypothetical protein
MFVGKVVAVGVAGRTLTDVCGDLGTPLLPSTLDCTELVLEEVEEVFECVCTWWRLRMDETEDEVDLRPRKPAEDRR